MTVAIVVLFVLVGVSLGANLAAFLLIRWVLLHVVAAVAAAGHVLTPSGEVHHELPL